MKVLNIKNIKKCIIGLYLLTLGVVIAWTAIKVDRIEEGLEIVVKMKIAEYHINRNQKL